MLPGTASWGMTNHKSQAKTAQSGRARGFREAMTPPARAENSAPRSSGRRLMNVKLKAREIRSQSKHGGRARTSSRARTTLCQVGRIFAIGHTLLLPLDNISIELRRNFVKKTLKNCIFLRVSQCGGVPLAGARRPASPEPPCCPWPIPPGLFSAGHFHNGNIPVERKPLFVGPDPQARPFPQGLPFYR